MTMNLFDSLAGNEARQEQLGPGATVLRQFAEPEDAALLSAVRDVVALTQCAPFPVHLIDPSNTVAER